MGRKKTIEDEELLAHARQLFLEKGSHVSTKEIAVHSGLAQATLFQRFPTKDSLFRAAMLPPKPDMELIMGVAANHDDTKSALIAICGAMLTYFRSMMPVALQLLAYPNFSMDDILAQFQKNNPQVLAQGLAEFLRQANSKGSAHVADPVAASGLLIAALHSLALFEIMGMHEGQFPDAAVANMVNSLWNGIAPSK